MGGNIYAYVKSPYQCIQIRSKYSKNGELNYSYYKGISLKEEQWNSFIGAVGVIEGMHSYVRDAIPCQLHEDHANQMGFMNCVECNPNGYGTFNCDDLTK